MRSCIPNYFKKGRIWNLVAVEKQSLIIRAGPRLLGALSKILWGGPSVPKTVQNNWSYLYNSKRYNYLLKENLHKNKKLKYIKYNLSVTKSKWLKTERQNAVRTIKKKYIQILVDR